MSKIALELLAAAKNYEIGCTAIACGADAVYIGAPAFGARAAASNSIDDIARLCNYAHLFGARVYVTMNTILFDNEVEEAKRMATKLWKVGVDALIVQDMAYLEMQLPITLHASTQCDIRTPQKAAWLAKAGFTRLVLPREFTVAQIAEASSSSGLPVEVFIHGARCVSYSGDCQMGFAATGRSANRGTCPQMCRLPFDLVDSEGNELGPRRHYLSLSDLRTTDLIALAEAGAVSFKIEGRLKDRRYIANVTAWYSEMLDKAIAASGGKYCRASSGRVNPGFAADIEKGFFRRSNGGGKSACLSSPNDTGVPIGKVTAPYSPKTRKFGISKAVLANGDGLGFFDVDGNFHGFRLNRADGPDCYPAQTPGELLPGTIVYRNSDKVFNDSIDSAKPERRLKVDFALSFENGKVVVEAKAETGATAKASVDCEDVPARTPQTEQRHRILGKLGDSFYYLGTVDDRLGNLFVPAAALTDVRRRAIEELSAAILATHRRDLPGQNNLSEDAFASMPPLNYHDNVANRIAEHFYISHGATIASKALECGRSSDADGKRVMATRYCIRRELGACLQTTNAQKLPTPLFIRNESGTYRLDFDCERCGMNIIKVKVC